MERLSCTIQEVKFARDSSADMTFSGYGSVFGNVDSYGDVVAQGAFADCLAAARKADQWPAMLLQHGGMGLSAEDMTPIGVWTDMSEDSTGLKVTGKLADTPRAREVYSLMKMTPRPAINGLSIGFIAKEWTMRSKPEEPRRVLKKVDLMEVSLVTFPANRAARVQQVKSLDQIEDLSGVESFLREVGGLSRTEAKAVVSRMLAIARRDVAKPDPSAEIAAVVASLKGRQALLAA